MRKDLTTWRELITRRMDAHKDGWDHLVSCTLSDEELDVKFDDGYGISQGKPFTLWTTGYVYFPIVYDGAEYVGSVSRSPDGEPTEHFGGE